MNFNSLEYIFFFVLVLSVHSVVRRRQWILLLLASYYFYSCWKVEYLPLLLWTTLLNYFCAIAIFKCKEKEKKKVFLVICLAGSLGLLFFYKYFDFLGGAINGIYMQFDVPRVVPTLNLVLPIGISFYTFQALGYTIDVFSGKEKPEKHLGTFSLFISFFPQLVAGPIERAGNLLVQLRKHRSFDYEQAFKGFQIAIWGLFKKMVIADRLAQYVDAVYGNVGHYPGLAVLMAAYFFAFQIYCDFSGYTDIAIGCAKMMGYDLRKNFDAPYFSASIPEFWRRWHISLMSWFKDYLYIPLGGGRRGEARKQCNQFIVFLLSGLWHGAGFTFLFWGLYHAVLQIISNLTASARRRIFASLGIGPKIVRITGTILTFHLVTFGWIFFRSVSISHAVQIIKKIPQGLFDVTNILGPFDLTEITIALLSIGLLLIVDFAQGKEKLARAFERSPILLRYPSYAMLVVGLLMLGVFNEDPFLYFQF